MQVGLDILAEKPILASAWGRCGLVANQASATNTFVPAWKILQEAIGSKLVALFGPQHGFESTVQENMIETEHARHRPSGLPVYSLYSETREPTKEMMADLDTLVFDLQITGCRIYTYKYTLAGCLRAAKKFGKRVVILDRHNPIGGTFVEGNVLENGTESFVGEFAIPMRHGLTMGEAGKFFNADIGADLEIVKLNGWNPEKHWNQYERQWILTSPNLQNMDACSFFPGMVLFEGTNVSEGRGTTLPFQFIGAPFIKDSEAFVSRIKQLMPDLEGVYLRATSFQPAFHKWKDKECGGVQLHLLDGMKLASYRLGLATLRACIEVGHHEFKWREPPYEYEYKLLPIEILMGSRRLVSCLEESKKFDLNTDVWSSGLNNYISKISRHLLYDRQMRTTVV